MTQWINPLDRVPQIPQDWANHISQGGLWTCLMIALLYAFPGVHIHHAALWAFYVMTAVSVGKKVVDYFMEQEPAWMCIGKALVTLLWPLSLVLVGM